jgi:DNA-binding protein Fis
MRIISSNILKYPQISISCLSPFFIIILLIATAAPAYAQKTGEQTDAVLTSAESFFKSLKGKDYTKIWSLLSQKSQDTIVDDIFKETLKNQSSQTPATEYSKEQIFADLKVGGSLSKAYWNSFLEYFDPDVVLNQSKWDIGTVKKDRAEISIQYKKSDNPAMLQMFKENNTWKVGLVETFWTRK